MFENSKVNQIWLADYCFLTRRYAYSGVSNRYYDPNPSRTEWRGLWHKKGLKKNQTFFPKWAKYVFDSSQFRKGTRFRAIDKIPVYKTPIVMFAVMDAASRFIIHAHLKQAPEEFLSRSYAFPSYFNFEECFEDSFKFQEQLGRFGHPIRLFLDGYVYRNYSPRLKEKAFSIVPVKEGNHYLLSPLDGFFGRVQYELRKGLTPLNLRRYIKHYNYERSHSALKNKTPSSVFFDDSKEVYCSMLAA